MLDWLKEIKEIALVTKSQNRFRQVWKQILILLKIFFLKTEKSGFLYYQIVD